jgi:hypothetical protein
LRDIPNKKIFSASREIEKDYFFPDNKKKKSRTDEPFEGLLLEEDLLDRGESLRTGMPGNARQEKSFEEKNEVAQTFTPLKNRVQFGGVERRNFYTDDVVQNESQKDFSPVRGILKGGEMEKFSGQNFHPKENNFSREGGTGGVEGGESFFSDGRREEGLRPTLRLPINHSHETERGETPEEGISNRAPATHIVRAVPIEGGGAKKFFVTG